MLFLLKKRIFPIHFDFNISHYEANDRLNGQVYELKNDEATNILKVRAAGSRAYGRPDKTQAQTTPVVRK